MALQFTDANFETEVEKSEQPVLVDFWAPWCGPCQIIGPTIEELSREVTSAKIGKLNVDENPATAQKYGVMSIPTLKVYKGGQVVKEFVGVQPKEVLLAALQSA